MWADVIWQFGKSSVDGTKEQNELAHDREAVW
jgi:hypothetical protein